LAGTVLHRLFLLFIAQPYNLAAVLSLNVVIPVAVVNCLGCVLFIWVMRDLDRDKWEAEVRKEQLLKQEAELRTRQAEQREQDAHLLKHEAELREQEARSLKEKAELRALRGQVEPHFLNNILNGICSLISDDQDKAIEYVLKLAAFFNATRRYASANTISLRDELEQLGRYLDLQKLRFGEKFRYQADDIPPGLLDCQLTPLSLLTLAENALDHGMKGCADGILLSVSAVDLGDSLALRVADNGCGIPSGRLADLLKAPVESQNSHGNGVALYILNQSLELAFPGRAGMAIASKQGTEVIMTLPKDKE
jgi:two-component system sensor histidine kinase LytS